MLRQTLTAAIVATAFWAMASGCERAPVNSVGSPSGTGSAALFSFESLEEVARVVKTDVPPEAQKSFSVERSAEHATEGAFCLKVSFPTEGWDPGIVLEDVPKDWSQYRWLKADVYNPLPAMVRLEFRADDGALGGDKRSKKDYLFWSQNVKPGVNTYAVELADARTFDEMRFFDLTSVKRITFFLGMRPDDTVLYIDNVRLEK